MLLLMLCLRKMISRKPKNGWKKQKKNLQSSTDPGQYINLNADSRHTGFYIPLNEIPENLRDFVKKEDKTAVFGPYNDDGTFKSRQAY